jgi:hypothetical protein
MQGQLFTQDFLTRGIDATPPWQETSADAMTRFEQALQAIFAQLPPDSAINEAQTEALIILPVLAELGWGADVLPQVNLSGKRRDDVPDLLLFADSAAKAAAINEGRDERRYGHVLALLEAKRWQRALDRGDAVEPADPGAPSSQMLRYLSRAEVVSDRRIQWGVLSNGAVWRLYWQGARSRAEEFFEVDLDAALGRRSEAAGTQAGEAAEQTDPARALKLFFLFFHRAAFFDPDLGRRRAQFSRLRAQRSAAVRRKSLARPGRAGF